MNVGAFAFHGFKKVRTTVVCLSEPTSAPSNSRSEIVSVRVPGGFASRVAHPFYSGVEPTAPNTRIFLALSFPFSHSSRTEKIGRRFLIWNRLLRRKRHFPLFLPRAARENRRPYFTGKVTAWRAVENLSQSTPFSLFLFLLRRCVHFNRN